MINSYYVENVNCYIEGFADYILNLPDDEFTPTEANKHFKEYMYDFKNIVVDLRTRFWKEAMLSGMRKAGFRFNHYYGEM